MPTISLSADESARLLLLFTLYAVLAVPVCLVLRWWYRRAVLRAMRRSFRPSPAPPDVAAAPQPAPGAPPPRELRIEVLDAGRPEGIGAAAQALFRLAVRARWSLALVYALAGGAYTLAALLIYNFALPPAPGQDQLVRLCVSLTLLWPMVPVVAAVGVASRGGQLLGPVLYLLFVLVVILFLPREVMTAEMSSILDIPKAATSADAAAVILLVVLGLSPRALMGFIMFVMFLSVWPLVTAVPTVMFLAFQYFRAVGIVVGFAVLLLLIGAGAAMLLTKLGVGSWAYAALWAAVLAGAAAASWLLIKLLARRYAGKKMSDQSVVIDSYWLALSVCLWVVGLAFYDLRYAPLFLLPFVAYKLALWAGLRLLRKGAAGSPDIRLLLLRVFGSKRHTGRLLEELGRFWRYVGSIQLIAGADLATTNLEIHEFLDFVSRRLGDRFVKDSADLRGQLGALDLRPDPDGRYRVNEFFCYDDTWRETLVELVRRSDVVVMDLRGFARHNQGCVFEINQLLNVVPAHRLVLTTDGRTDFHFLYATLYAAWRGMDADSPNRDAAAPVVRVLYAPRQTSRAVRRLLSILFEAAQSARRPAPAQVESV